MVSGKGASKGGGMACAGRAGRQLVLAPRPGEQMSADGSRAGRGRRNRLGSLAEHQNVLYGSRQDYDAMIRTVEAMVDDTRARINALVLRSDDLGGALGRWTPKPYELEMKKLGDKTVLTLEKRGKPPEPRAGRLRIAIAEMPDNPDHHCAVSDCTSAEFTNAFTAFMSKYSPRISRLFLTSGDMSAVLGGVESLGYGVTITYGSTKSRLRGTGVLESIMKSTSLPRADFFRDLDKGEKAAVTVRYTARTDDEHDTVAARGTIARDCRFSASVGAGLLFRTVIPKALALSLERNERIDASAKSAEDGTVEPTVIRFARQIFKNKKINRRYVDTIAKMPDSSISAYSVNPHIHLSLVDYTDGSSYDIWILDGNRLTIVPQIRASGASLKRLVNYLLEHMGEGSVEKYEH